MDSGNTSSIDRKHRLGFALDVFAKLVWRSELQNEGATHYMGVGSEGQLVVIPQSKYQEWEKGINLAVEKLGTASVGKLSRLVRGFSSLAPFVVSIEGKRVRFTLPRDLRAMGFMVEAGVTFSVTINYDLFEIIPADSFKNVDGPFAKMVSAALNELRAMAKEDWGKITLSS